MGDADRLGRSGRPWNHHEQVSRCCLLPAICFSLSRGVCLFVADSLLAAAWYCRESTYEFGIQDGTGALQGAFGPGCWRWWGTAVLALNEWTHVGAGVDGTNEKHFVNGAFAEQDGCAGSLTINNDDFMIGARGGDGAHGSQFKGAVDEAMVFGAMLSDDEVQAIYVATSVDEPPSINVQDFAAMASGKLVGYWKLDGNAVDESANGLTGTPVNEEWVDGFSGLAFYLSGDDTIRVHDGGSSPLDVDNVLMLAWVMPTDWATVADRGIIMNKSVAPLPAFALVSQSWCVMVCHS